MTSVDFLIDYQQTNKLCKDLHILADPLKCEKLLQLMKSDWFGISGLGLAKDTPKAMWLVMYFCHKLELLIKTVYCQAKEVKFESPHCRKFQKLSDENICSQFCKYCSVLLICFHLISIQLIKLVTVS